MSDETLASDPAMRRAGATVPGHETEARILIVARTEDIARPGRQAAA